MASHGSLYVDATIYLFLFFCRSSEAICYVPINTPKAKRTKDIEINKIGGKAGKVFVMEIASNLLNIVSTQRNP